MIRVNLLPIKQARRRSQGRMQLLLFVGLILIEVGVLFTAYMLVNEELVKKRDEVATLQNQVDALDSEVAEVDELRASLSELDEQLRVLSELEAMRIGPVRMLDEIQAMLSPPRNEEDRISQLRRDWDVDWDTRRVWVQSFRESEGTFEMDGFAGRHDDVAEFLRRMTTAYYFDDVQLDEVQRVGGQGDQELVRFRIYGNLSYRGFDGSSGSEAQGS